MNKSAGERSSDTNALVLLLVILFRVWVFIFWRGEWFVLGEAGAGVLPLDVIWLGEVVERVSVGVIWVVEMIVNVGVVVVGWFCDRLARSEGRRGGGGEAGEFEVWIGMVARVGVGCRWPLWKIGRRWGVIHADDVRATTAAAGRI